MEPCGASHRAADRNGWNRLTSILAAGYLLFQLLVPLIVVARPEPATRDFSWDMFSHHLTCAKVYAVARPRGGSWEPVRLESDFSGWMQLSRVLMPGRLDAYAARVCAKLRAERQRAVELHFMAECHDDRGTVTFPLVDPARDYCSP